MSENVGGRRYLVILKLHKRSQTLGPLSKNGIRTAEFAPARSAPKPKVRKVWTITTENGRSKGRIVQQ